MGWERHQVIDPGGIVEVLLGVGWFGAGARPLGVCPAHQFRMGFHAFPGGGLVEVLLRVGLVGAGAKPLGVCPAPGFHASPGEGLGEVLLRVGLVSAGARPLGVCPAPRFRMGFHAFPRGAPGPYPRAGR